MKAKYVFAVLTMGMSVSAMAQETDDMYFNAKDRQVVVASNQVALSKRYQQEDLNAVRNRPVNPSDSYSGRGVNPEFNAQTKNGTTIVQNNPDYFVPNYQPTNVNKSLYNGTGSYASNYNNCNCGMNNPYYGMGGYSGFGSPYGYSSPYSSFYSPYSSFYSPYGSMYSPYGYYSPYSSGLSMMMGYGSGFGMYSGIGYGFGSMYSSMYGGYGYPGGVVVINNYDSRPVTSGRHPSRSSSINNNYVGSGSTTAATNGRSRVSGTDVGTRSSQTNYYDRTWRNNSDNFTRTSSFGTNGGSNSWGNSDSGSRTRSSFDTFGTGGGGTRSSFGGGGSVGGGSSGGGGGGGHTRGRN